MDLVPDTGQLSQVMVQATAPAFILGAVAGFVSILLGRMTNVIRVKFPAAGDPSYAVKLFLKQFVVE
jgi:hypothetical protein